MSKNNNVSEDIKMTALVAFLTYYRRHALCPMRFASLEIMERRNET